MSDETKKMLSDRNTLAIAETLTHHGKCLGELEAQIHALNEQNVLLRQELSQQKQLIVKSLQQKYGHGSTTQ